MSDMAADCFACGHHRSDHALAAHGPPAAEPIDGLAAVTVAASGGDPDQRRIAREGMRWLALLLAKNRDYGSSAWRAPVLAAELAPRDALLVRMSDKVERLRSLRARDAAVPDESYADTMRDLGAYALLWLCAPASPRALPRDDADQLARALGIVPEERAP